MIRFYNQGIAGRQLDWLIIILTIRIHNHYTRRLTMKKTRLIKNKIMTITV